MAATTAALLPLTEAAAVLSADSREGLLVAAAAVSRSGTGILLGTGLAFYLGRADG